MTQKNKEDITTFKNGNRKLDTYILIYLLKWSIAVQAL